MFCHTEGFALPHVDTRHARSLAAGVYGRMGKDLPPVKDINFYGSLKIHAQQWIEDRKITPVAADYDFSLEAWLKKTHYPEWRKEQLRKISEEVTHMLERNDANELKNFKIKLFCKDECYVDFKHARGIYAREDVAKVMFGPYFKAIEEIIYKEPEFIKHVPVRDRAEYITERLYTPGGRYAQTDYSSFESLFNADLMENCEFVVYDHMLGGIPSGGFMLDLFREVLQGKNRIENKFFHAMVEACRMSGEMNTSLGNGLSNLMLFSYLCAKNKVECIGVVEGDDGLFVFTGKVPSTQDFTDMGCLIKLEIFNELSKASFCGLLFDPEAKQIVTDPFEVLAQFGWTTKEYAKASRNKLKMLLRSKSLSYLYQYPGCPIINELAAYGLRVTASYDVRHYIRNGKMSMWEREQLIDAFENKHLCVREEPKLATRLLFEELYGIGVSEQLMIEKYLRDKTDLSPLRFPSLSNAVNPNWVKYYNLYGVDLKQNEDSALVEFKLVDYPTLENDYVITGNHQDGFNVRSNFSNVSFRKGLTSLK